MNPPDSTPSYMPVPEEITRAAETVANWAAKNGFESWEIGPVAERAMVSRLRDRVREAELESQEKSMHVGSLMRENEALKAINKSLQKNPRFTMICSKIIASALFPYYVSAAVECEKTVNRIESRGGDSSNMLGAAQAYRNRLKDIERDIQEILDTPIQAATV